ncbi:MAG: Mur ligase family protein, partial [Acidimicrobiales bacterium]
MTLLLDAITPVETTGEAAGVEVGGIEHDSRRVGPGDLFCCLPGRTSDGHDHAGDAVGRGAVGLVCERPVGALPRPVVQVRVARTRPAMARLAAALFGEPSSSLEMIGVTGTNGKTTVTHLLGAVFARAGNPVAVLGTLSGARTTPESPALQRTLAGVRDRHPAEPRPVVAMEVSSHALVQSRVDAIRFDVAVFTNLSHDHLDFHGSMEEYFAAKASLFTPERAARAVVWADDPWGRRLLGLLAARNVAAVPVGAALASGVHLAPGRSTFTWRDQPVTLALTGAVNVRNALLAAETARALGMAPADVAAGLGSAPPVRGRLEVVAAPGPGGPSFAVLVDYAHTPAGIEVVLEEARRLVAPAGGPTAPAGGRVAVVFGCGGDRDRSKRPLMGAAAALGADLAVVTSDNPRHENPAAIIDEVLSFPGAAAA